jgi:DNA-binding NtrC family response regulator
MTLQERRKIEILLWDAHTAERELIEEMLTNIGCNVTAVVNEEDCLAEFSKKKYQLVIFEQGLPDLDVNKFVEELAEIDPLTPIAMMATLAIEFYEKRYGHSNIDFLVVKPFELVELQRLVEEASELSERLKGTH